MTVGPKGCLCVIGLRNNTTRYEGLFRTKARRALTPNERNAARKIVVTSDNRYYVKLRKVASLDPRARLLQFHAPIHGLDRQLSASASDLALGTLAYETAADGDREI